MAGKLIKKTQRQKEGKEVVGEGKEVVGEDKENEGETKEEKSRPPITSATAKNLPAKTTISQQKLP